ncbi:Uncharacterised protein [uncultured archaeon]|nr:Uncharacterised protein [uncultured archaeon]
MYVQQSFRETYELVKKNWVNAVLYTLPVLVISGIVLALTLIGYVGGIFSFAAISAIPAMGIGMLALLAMAGIIAFALLILVSAFFNLMSERVAYLTSMGAAVPLSKDSLYSLIDYAKANFIAFFRLLLLTSLVSVGVMALFFLAYLLLLAGTGKAQGYGGVFLALAALLAATAAVAFAVILGTFSTARILFFMGNENAGALRLVGAGWSTFVSNLSEYAFFGLAYLGVALAYMLVVFALSMVCLGPLTYIIGFIYSFATSVLLFVFVSRIAPKKPSAQAI